jgi:hypothetical protein
MDYTELKPGDVLFRGRLAIDEAAPHRGWGVAWLFTHMSFSL